MTKLQPDQVLMVVACLSSVGVALSSIELAAATHQRTTHQLILITGTPANARLGSRRGVIRTVSAARLLASVWVVLGTLAGSPSAIPVLAIAASALLLPRVVPFGYDSADVLSGMTFIVIAVHLVWRRWNVAHAVCWFLALQVSLAYAVAAATKLRSEVWGGGQALRLVFRSQVFGFQAVEVSLSGRRPQAVLTAGEVAIIAVEVLLAVSLMLPDPILAAVLWLGVAFHLTTSFVSGLYNFFWTFTAIYPAVWYSSQSGFLST